MRAIQDQRTTTGKREHVTVDDVRSFWRAAAANGEIRHHGRPVEELRYSDLKSTVYISAGRFVADCPFPTCNGGATCWVENPEACCLDCGTVFTPVWPTKKDLGGELEEAVEILALRPNPLWRNFRASHPGETIDDLKAQNLAVGDGLPGGKPAKGPHPLDPTLIRGR